MASEISGGINASLSALLAGSGGPEDASTPASSAGGDAGIACITRRSDRKIFLSDGCCGIDQAGCSLAGKSSVHAGQTLATEG